MGGWWYWGRFVESGSRDRYRAGELEVNKEDGEDRNGDTNVNSGNNRREFDGIDGLLANGDEDFESQDERNVWA